MTYLLKGALVEYGTDLFGPIKNTVIFQINPDTLTRTIQIPSSTPPNATNTKTEKKAAGTSPTEDISFTAHFYAADKLNTNNPIAKSVGLGPQLSALEQMVYPLGTFEELLSGLPDPVGDLVFSGSDKADSESESPIPRKQLPSILFIWGLSRVLPVKIKSMSITEKQYDHLLNPIQAEVSLTLEVLSEGDILKDPVAKGALEWTNMAKKTQAITNLTNSGEEIIDLIPF